MQFWNIANCPKRMVATSTRDQNWRCKIKVGKLLLELKEDAQTRQTDKESIVTETMIKDQEFIIHQAKELLKTMKKVIECNKIIRRKARQLKTYNTKQQKEVRKFYKI